MVSVAQKAAITALASDALRCHAMGASKALLEIAAAKDKSEALKLAFAAAKDPNRSYGVKAAIETLFSNR